MTHIEAMKLALEALEGLEALLLSMGLTHLIVYGDAEKAITNLQKQLEEQPAQPQQDDAWKAEQKTLADEAVKCATEALANPNHPATMAAREYYGAAQPQEPVQRYSPDGEGGMEVDSLGAWMKFTSPPAQRKPLTKSQVLDLWEQTYVQRRTTGIEFARAIEAAHGIKENT